MDTTPSFVDVLTQARRGDKSDDVRIFYEYFEALKAKVRGRIIGKVKVGVGESAVVQSAIASMFLDVDQLNLPIGDRDSDGQPMLWPLLLGYLERHCDKWNKYFNTRKRKGGEVRLGGDESGAGLQVAAKEEGPEEDRIEKACETLAAKLNPEEAKAFEQWVAGKTLAESAAALGCSEAKVSYLRKRIKESLTAG